MGSMDKTCHGCGSTVTVPVPADIGGRALSYAQRIPVLCDQCAEQADQVDRDREVQAKRREHQARIDRSGLPGALQGELLQRLTQQDPAVLAAARRWAAGDLAGLLLTGPVGAGKTTIAAAATWERLSQRGVLWRECPRLFAQLGTGLGSAARDDALAVLLDRGALVLDDLDKARPTEYGAEHMFAAIDARLTSSQPLLVTANLTLGELAERWPAPYGEAIASRLRATCQSCHVEGPDRRTTSAPVLHIRPRERGAAAWPSS